VGDVAGELTKVDRRLQIQRFVSVAHEVGLDRALEIVRGLKAEEIIAKYGITKAEQLMPGARPKILLSQSDRGLVLFYMAAKGRG
jgi:hypothetical protein